MTTMPTAPNGHSRAFVQIEGESLRLLAKNPVARFADKSEDSNVVVGLVGRLQEAIISYQVGTCSSAPGVVDSWSRYRSSKQSTVKSYISQ